jgi:hypothetical protein
MNLDSILQELKDQRSRIDAAIAALGGISGGGISTGKRRGRPPGTKNAPKKRTMSAAARKRIGEAMRKRWAAARKSGKKRL